MGGLPPRGVESRACSPGRRAERSGARLALGTTKEVLGSIIDLLDFKDFLGSPILLLGFPKISIRILSGF